MKSLDYLRALLLVAFIVGSCSQLSNANPLETVESGISYSNFEGSFSKLATRVSRENETTYVELFGNDYQKVALDQVEGETGSFRVPNGRIVFSLGANSKILGFTHHIEDGKSLRRVFAQKIGKNAAEGEIFGEYLYGGYTIIEENKKLFLQRNKNGEIEVRELIPVSEREFLIKGDDERFEFVLGEDGRANKIVRHRKGRSVSIVPRVQQLGQKGLKIGPQRFRGDWEGGGALAMFWSHDPTIVNESITRVIISIHGGSRDGVGYYEYARDMSIALGVDNSTMVLAPHFLEPRDGFSESVLTWASNDDVDWRKGDNSSNFGAVSNFEVLDKLVESAVYNCPNLENIVVVGHSAGGQVVTRYSTGTQSPEALQLNTPGEPRILYVVSNPSSYSYFSDKRWTDGTWPEGYFEAIESECSSSRGTQSHYEFINRNDYMSRQGLDLEYNFKRRRVVYLLGEQDNKNDPGLDRGCDALRQGENRLERGHIFLDHLRDEFGPSNVPGHAIVVVPEVGHDGWSMYNSFEGLELLFGYKHDEANRVPIINQYNINRVLSERHLHSESTEQE